MDLLYFCTSVSVKEIVIDMKNNDKRWPMKVTTKAWLLGLLFFLPLTISAQQVLTLDSCRAMALRNNKEMSMSRIKQEVATNLKKSARTQYLPQVNAVGGYLWSSKEVSLLDDDQKLIWIWGNSLSGRLPDEIINHRNFSEFAYMLLGDQRPGYKIQIDDTKVPACRHIFDTLSGGCMDLGKMYSNADYTMIFRWAEWCPFSAALVPEVLDLANKYKDLGLQTIWAYAGGNEGQRIAFMSYYGLDKEKYHIVECSHSDFIPLLGDHAVWLNPVYETPFVEIVDREGHIVFISDDYDNFSSYSFSHHTSELESFLYSIFN